MGKNDAPPSSKGKGKTKAKDRTATYTSSSGKGKTVVSSSSGRKGSTSSGSTQQSQYYGSAPNNSSYGLGTQFSEPAGQQTFTGEQGEQEIDLESSSGQYNQPPDLQNASGFDITYKTLAYENQPSKYGWRQTNSPGFNAVTGVAAITTDMREMQIAEYPTKPLTSSSYPSTYPSAYTSAYPSSYPSTGQSPPIPIANNTGQSSTTQDTSEGYETPRVGSYDTLESAARAGYDVGGQSGESASRGANTEYQKQKYRAREPIDWGDYKVRKSKEFEPGRVLKMFWFEPPGAGSRDEDDATSFGGNSFQDQRLSGKVRRFVIVESNRGHSICVPITTYGGRACTKQGCMPYHHSMIYTGKQPQHKKGEQIPSTNRPIEMRAIAGEVLDRTSRINYAKKYTVEHNFRVKFIGTINKTKTTDAFWMNVNIVNRTGMSNPPAPQPSIASYNQWAPQTQINYGTQASSSRQNREPYE